MAAVVIPAGVLTSQHSVNGIGPYTVNLPYGGDGANPTGVRNLGASSIEATIVPQLGEFVWVPATQSGVGSHAVTIPSGCSSFWVYNATFGWIPYIGENTVSNTDYYLEVAKGNIAGSSLEVIRGHKSDIDSADGPEDIWEESGNITYLTTSETMDISSTDVADDSGGTGLETVFISGVDNTGAFLSETVTLNGTANVLTVGSYLRVNTMAGLAVGSGGTNAGVITATASTAATVQNRMDAGEGVSQSSHYTIPLATTGYLYQVELDVDRSAGGTAPGIEVRGLSRSGGAGNCWAQIFGKTIDTTVTDEQDISLPFPISITARSDIRFTVDTDQDNSECRTRMYLMIVED
jgi:hypothetical protein